jgi:hypothetical protein
VLLAPSDQSVKKKIPVSMKIEPRSAPTTNVGWLANVGNQNEPRPHLRWKKKETQAHRVGVTRSVKKRAKEKTPIKDPGFGKETTYY